MTISATSSAGRMVEGAIELLKESSTWQTRVNDNHGGGATAANARNHIYEFETYKPDSDHSDLRPFINVGLIDASFDPLVEGSSQRWLQYSGQVGVVLTDDARLKNCFGSSATDAYGDSYFDALNWIYGIMDDLAEGVFNDEDNYPFDSIESLEFKRNDVKFRETNDYWIAVFVLAAGASQ